MSKEYSFIRRAPSIRCRYLDTSDEENRHRCLAMSGTPIVVSDRYAESFCLSRRHTACDLYVRSQGVSIDQHTDDAQDDVSGAPDEAPAFLATVDPTSDAAHTGAGTSVNVDTIDESAHVSSQSSNGNAAEDGRHMSPPIDPSRLHVDDSGPQIIQPLPGEIESRAPDSGDRDDRRPDVRSDSTSPGTDEGFRLGTADSTLGIPTITAPLDHESIDGDSLTVTGTAEAGVTVQVFDWLISVGTTTVDGSGHWSLHVENLETGYHAFLAQAHQGSVDSPRSSAITITTRGNGQRAYSAETTTSASWLRSLTLRATTVVRRPAGTGQASTPGDPLSAVDNEEMQSQSGEGSSTATHLPETETKTEQYDTVPNEAVAAPFHDRSPDTAIPTETPALSVPIEPPDAIEVASDDREAAAVTPSPQADDRTAAPKPEAETEGAQPMPAQSSDASEPHKMEHAVRPQGRDNSTINGKRPSVRVLIVAAAVVLVGALTAFLVVSLGHGSRHAPPTPRVTSLLPGTRFWSFTVPPPDTTHTVLTFSNSQNVSVSATIREDGAGGRTVGTVQIPAAGGVEVELAAALNSHAVVVGTTGSAVPARIVVTRAGVRVDRGHTIHQQGHAP